MQSDDSDAYDEPIDAIPKSIAKRYFIFETERSQ